jgi:hypothetical protein
MSWILIRVPVAVVSCTIGLMSGASAVAAPVVAEPAGRGPVPLDVAPAKIDSSFAWVTYDCGNQSPIRIVGEDSNITLTGSCGEVDISGTANTVDLQSVAIIKVTGTGTGNHVAWKTGPVAASHRSANPGGINEIRGPGGVQIQSR